MIPTPSHLLDHISPIFAPFFLVFCAFSQPRRDGSNEPQAGTQGQETAGTGAQTAGNTVSPVGLTPGVRITKVAADGLAAKDPRIVEGLEIRRIADVDCSTGEPAMTAVQTSTGSLFT